MVLLVATVGAAFIDLGRFNFALAMVIAVAKAVMILLIFMHVRYSDRLIWVFSSRGVPLAGDPDRAVAERLLHPRLAEHPGQVVTPTKPVSRRAVGSRPITGGWPGSGADLEPLPQLLAPAQREQRAGGQGRQGVLVLESAGTSGRLPGRPSSAGKDARGGPAPCPPRWSLRQGLADTSRPVRTAGPEP